MSWSPDDRILLWGAASRAIWSPTPFDEDVVETIGPTVFLTGNDAFRTEKLTAFELGLRAQPSDSLSFSISSFYNLYGDLRSIEINPAGFLPLRWGNVLKGESYGAEAWADLKLAPWWRLTAAYSLLRQDYTFKAGSSQIIGVSQIGNDPRYQASLRSSMDVGNDFTVDATLRHVGRQAGPAVPAYAELNARVGWRLSTQLQLSLSGFNLLHAYHQQYGGEGSYRTPRSILVGIRWHH